MARHASACTPHTAAEKLRGPTRATTGVLAAIAAMLANAAVDCTAPYTCGERPAWSAHEESQALSR